MFDEMRAAGSKLPDMVEALQSGGWKTRHHHDNWYHPSNPDKEYDTHEAYKILLFTPKAKVYLEPHTGIEK